MRHAFIADLINAGTRSINERRGKNETPIFDIDIKEVRRKISHTLSNARVLPVTLKVEQGGPSKQNIESPTKRLRLEQEEDDDSQIAFSLSDVAQTSDL